MRTTLDIPEELLADAQAALRFKSKTDTVIFSLRELLRHKRIEDLKAMFGHVELDVDVPRSRRRPRRRK